MLGNSLAVVPKAEHMHKLWPSNETPEVDSQQKCVYMCTKGHTLFIVALNSHQTTIWFTNKWHIQQWNSIQ